MSNLKVVWSVKSECGPIREKNEDSVYPEISGSSLVPFRAGVFDGMGGRSSTRICKDASVFGVVLGVVLAFAKMPAYSE